MNIIQSPTNYSLSSHNGKFVEAEMPQDDHIEPSPEDGMYHCPHPKCTGRAPFSQKGLFRKHIRQHVKPIRCPLCNNFSAAQRKDVYRHIATHNSKGQPFVCQLCAKQFTRNDNLQRHYKTQHSVSSNGLKI
ncbi:hypothetical protein BDV59DRAFT_177628, partial [Aspergillus ambiguus]|uniref:uncharacterized protein n=1 Tax=Aspergillus ambiguus TaxID=176160 RepID=UPI003CCCCDDF